MSDDPKQRPTYESHECPDVGYGSMAEGTEQREDAAPPDLSAERRLAKEWYTLNLDCYRCVNCTTGEKYIDIPGMLVTYKMTAALASQQNQQATAAPQASKLKATFDLDGLHIEEDKAPAAQASACPICQTIGPCKCAARPQASATAAPQAEEQELQQHLIEHGLIEPQASGLRALAAENVELRHRIADHQCGLRADGWVSVGERLPKRVVDVLVKYSGFSGESAPLIAAMMSVGWLTVDDGTWQLEGANGIPDVTHWRALPAPPQQPKEGHDE